MGVIKEGFESLMGIGKPKQQVRRQEAKVDTQMSTEKRRLASETSEVKKKQALMKRGGAGRSLLIRTSPKGVQTNGGGATKLGGGE